MKRIGAIIGFSLLHLFVTMCLFAIVFSRGMAAFDKGCTEVTALDWIVGHILMVLWFPYYPFGLSSRVASGSIYDWGLVFGTSTLWGCALYLLFDNVRRWRNRRAVAPL